jgi:hypothetical protein
MRLPAAQAPYAFMDGHNLGLHGQAQTRCGAFAGVAGLRLRSLR